MYITITPQKLGDGFNLSVADFVEYLEKENQDKPIEDMEYFFNQDGEQIKAKDVVKDIDANTSKLKKTEPRFYSITVNPSKYELKHIQNDANALKAYTKAIMEDYAKAFNREIEGRAVGIQDIKYYAKIEHQRTYKGTDRVIRDNAPYYKRIVRLTNEIQQIKSGKLVGDIVERQNEIARLHKSAPHKIDGKLIEQGMVKQGEQSHIHIIVSRKDHSNRYSLSPGSKYKSTTVEFNGKEVKRGFDRDQFFKQAEQRFDQQFNYQRNFVESYQSRKLLKQSSKQYYAALLGLPQTEKVMAFKLLSQTGVSIPSIPTNQAQLALKVLKQMKTVIMKGRDAGSISI